MLVVWSCRLNNLRSALRKFDCTLTLYLSSMKSLKILHSEINHTITIPASFSYCCALQMRRQYAHDHFTFQSFEDSWKKTVVNSR